MDMPERKEDADQIESDADGKKFVPELCKRTFAQTFAYQYGQAQVAQIGPVRIGDGPLQTRQGKEN